MQINFFKKEIYLINRITKVVYFEKKIKIEQILKLEHRVLFIDRFKFLKIL